MSKKETKLPSLLASAGLMSAAGVAIVFAIILLLNVLGNAVSFRLDLTEDRRRHRRLKPQLIVQPFKSVDRIARADTDIERRSP